MNLADVLQQNLLPLLVVGLSSFGSSTFGNGAGAILNAGDATIELAQPQSSVR